MKKIAVLASGQGSNLHALLNATRQGELPAQICVVVSDNPNAKALSRAIDAAIPAEALPVNAGEKAAEYDVRLDRILRFYRPDFIVLAGFMRILSAAFVQKYTHQIVNIHPSLLPDYPGLETYARALADGQQMHGTTVHFVNEDLDQGPILAQVAIPITADETVDTLREKTQYQEHHLYPQVLGWLCNNLVRVEDGQIWLGDASLPKTGKHVPLRKA